MIKPVLVTIVLVLLVRDTDSRKPHVIDFRWPGLYPESFTWDPKSDHFVVGSTRLRELISVSDAGVTSALTPEFSIPVNSSYLGIALDPNHHRLLAVVHRPAPLFNALASYQLPTFRLLSLTNLPSAAVANDVAVDFSGNAYVTDSANDVIFKVNEQGDVSTLSKSPVFKSTPVDTTLFYRDCGLNGIVYSTKGYLLVTQSNTGKLYKVDAEDGTARRVILNKDLAAADGIAMRPDGVVLVVSRHKLYFIKSDDSWSEGVVFDQTPLLEERQASAVAVGAEKRVYVLYGHVNEGMTQNSDRTEFSIVEVKSDSESQEENVWIFVLIGFGLVYFLIWRFQMRHLVQKMNKKTA
ncbi:hypothetical protein F511_06394 [Dorcoceras hygrometricum]|uniref:SMP-30/Gluconolactonase/LRE-like region domain-containing protein n=1 Tax=Dorcoceras hygrometricum TaxID=472368 RepID=A0A2Z7AEP3_9LAMI|nr:hypothetical protein F511_06394 [Dorcoceras hygrometricum]